MEGPRPIGLKGRIGRTSEKINEKQKERERERWDESVHTVKRRVEPPSGAAGKIASESLYGLPAALLRNPLACPFF